MSGKGHLPVGDAEAFSGRNYRDRVVIIEKRGGSKEKDDMRYFIDDRKIIHNR